MIKRFLKGLTFGLVHRVPVYRIKVIYKSGAVHEFDAHEFTFTGSGYRWRVYDVQRNQPLEFGAPEVAAVWQVGARHVLQFGRKKGA